MSQANQTGAKVRARVLVSGAHGQVDQVIEIESSQVEALTGIVDTNPASVAYAESLTGSQAGEAPSLAELFAARDALLRRERELDERAQRLDEQEAANVAEAARLAEQAAANAAETQRLADKTFADSAAAAAAPPPDVKPGKAAK